MKYVRTYIHSSRPISHCVVVWCVYVLYAPNLWFGAKYVHCTAVCTYQLSTGIVLQDEFYLRTHILCAHTVRTLYAHCALYVRSGRIIRAHCTHIMRNARKKIPPMRVDLRKNTPYSSILGQLIVIFCQIFVLFVYFQQILHAYRTSKAIYFCRFTCIAHHFSQLFCYFCRNIVIFWEIFVVFGLFLPERCYFRDIFDVIHPSNEIIFWQYLLDLWDICVIYGNLSSFFYKLICFLVMYVHQECCASVILWFFLVWRRNISVFPKVFFQIHWHLCS